MQGIRLRRLNSSTLPAGQCRALPRWRPFGCAHIKPRAVARSLSLLSGDRPDNYIIQQSISFVKCFKRLACPPFVLSFRRHASASEAEPLFSPARLPLASAVNAETSGAPLVPESRIAFMFLGIARRPCLFGAVVFPLVQINHLPLYPHVIRYVRIVSPHWLSA